MLAEAKAKAEANLAGWQRAQADFINYKRRSEQERQELSQFANAVLILSLLPVLDDLERAFSAIPPRLAEAELAGRHQARRAQAPGQPGGTGADPD